MPSLLDLTYTFTGTEAEPGTIGPSITYIQGAILEISHRLSNRMVIPSALRGAAAVNWADTRTDMNRYQFAGIKVSQTNTGTVD